MKIRRASPPWLTKEQRREIHQLYCEAKGLTRLANFEIVYSVDHVIPLAGDGTTCGLHVPWNLRIIPKRENNRRQHYPEAPLTVVRLDRDTRQPIRL